MSEIVIFDTEYTSWPDAAETNWSHAGQHREIIQIAGLRWERGQSWQDAPTFMRTVRPVMNPKLSDFIIGFTGITQREVDEEGVSAEQAFREFGEFAVGLPCYSNGNDINPMAETAGLQRFVMPLDPRQCRNMRGPLYTALRAEAGEFVRREYPSGRVYELLGINLGSDAVHNALHDVRSLAATAQELERRGHELGLWR